MGQILSQSEIEAILSSIDFRPANTSPAAVSSSEKSSELPVYEFEHPRPLRRSHLDSLRLAAAAACRSIQTDLAGQLHTQISVTFLGIEQSTYREFVITAEKPSCLVQFRPDPAESPWVLEINRSVAVTWIDCILGGNGGSPVSIDRDFTELERRLIERIVCQLVKSISLGTNAETLTKLDHLVADGSDLPVADSNEAVALLTMEVQCGPVTGLLQFCLPWKAVANAKKLEEAERFTPNEGMKSSAVKVPVIATASLTRLSLSAGELSSLNPGDVLLTNVRSTDDIRLEVDGHEIFRGRPGQNQGKKAILLTAPITTPRLISTNPQSATGNQEAGNSE